MQIFQSNVLTTFIRSLGNSNISFKDLKNTFINVYVSVRASPVAQLVKNPPTV